MVRVIDTCVLSYRLIIVNSVCWSHALVPTSKTPASDGGRCSGQQIEDVVSCDVNLLHVMTSAPDMGTGSRSPRGDETCAYA